MGKKFNQFVNHLMRTPVVLFAEVVVSGGGTTLTLNRAGSQGVESITYLQNANHIITLQDRYNRVIYMNVSNKNPTANPTYYSTTVRNDTVSSDRQIRYNLRGGGGTGVNPSNGTTLLIEIWLDDHERDSE